MRRTIFLALSIATLPFLVSCSGMKSSSGNPPPPPPATGVTITPSSAMINKGGEQTFSASVNGATDQSVFWEIVEAVPTTGDSTHGFISNAGVYVAPAAVPNPPTVTIKAIALADTTKTGTAAVRLQPGPATSVSITSPSNQVSPFGQMQFMATVTGNSNTAVNWKVNGVAGGGTQTGTISTTGLYHAPNSVPVLTTGNNAGQTAEVVITAVSQADTTAMDSVLLDIVPQQQNPQGANSPLGVSGSNANDKSGSGANTLCCGGTLGALVSRGGNSYILSNNHVLARSDSATAGESIVQPGLIDNNCSAPPAVATLTQFFNLENGTAPNIDAALAKINSGAIDPTGTILQLGGVNSGGQPTNGAPHSGAILTSAQALGAPHNGLVAKSGRSTGLTCSSIFAINTSVTVDYQKGCGTGSTFSVPFSSQIDIVNSGFGAQGDSGSLIVTQDTADPVGLLFAGSASDTLANPISDILNGLADPANPASKPVLVGSASTHLVAACSLPGPQSATGARLAMQKNPASTETLQRALAAREAHAAELMAHPEVQAVGVGSSYDNAAEPAVLFFVTRGQQRSHLPAEVDGIRTRIVEGDFFTARGTVSASDSAALEQAAAPPQLVYSISEEEVVRARLVHAAHVNELMKRPGVQGVGIGSSADSPGEAALVVFLIKGAAHDPIPPTMDGLRTRVRETERFRAGFGQTPPQRGCSTPTAKKPGPISAAGPVARP
ncbi:MAG TPA: hypothetical protein VFQ18_07880 [Candidatus Acidoferrum sp.]|nr:hypothetical protein [Candidatus Acidoferrum sp.]